MVLSSTIFSYEIHMYIVHILKEQKDQTVTVRGYKQNVQKTMSVEEFLYEILKEIDEKSLPMNMR